MGDTRRHRGEFGAATIDSFMNEQAGLGTGRESRFGGGSGVPCESTPQVGRRFQDRSEGWTPETDDVPSSVQTIVCELLHQMGDLRRRLEVLEAREREESWPAASPEYTPRDNRHGPHRDSDMHMPGPRPAQDEEDDGDDVPVAADEDSPAVSGTCEGIALKDLPGGPLPLDAAAKVLGKTPRTLRGWCQIAKYNIPCHREGGRWHFYRDELVAWHEEYESISRRDAKRAQAKRRRTRNGNQAL
jgi:hypothetical protein